MSRYHPARRVLLALLAATLWSCGARNPPEPAVQQPATSFDCSLVDRHTIEDVYNAYFDGSKATGCTASKCHGGTDSASGQSGLTFSSAADLWSATVNKRAHEDPGLLVAPGDPAHSFLYQKLLPSAASRMPLGGPFLDDDGQAIVAGWICAGAPGPAPVPDAGPDAGSSDAGLAPVILSLTPGSGFIGEPVTIDGLGFSERLDANLVAFNGVPATVTAATTTSITTSVPGGATTGPVTVTVGDLTGYSLNPFAVKAPFPSPTLLSVSPAQWVLGSGDVTVELAGSDFVSASSATLDGSALSVTYVSPTLLLAVVPAATISHTGTFTISVSNPGPPGGGTSLGLPLELINPAPFIASLSPATVVTGSTGVTLTVSGSGFVPASAVSLNGASATSTYVDGSTLQVSVPDAALASPGTLSVVVTNPGPPGGGSSAPATLSVGNPVPTLTSVTPSSVQAGSGPATLTLTGSNFLPGSQARLDGAALATTYVSATQLTAVMADAVTATGATHQVTVFNAAPAGGESAAQPFTVNNPAPALTSISPTTVPTGGAPFTLTLTGSGFNPSSTVSFNGQPVAASYVSATSLTAQIPSIASAGSYGVTVTNPQPGGGTSSPVNLTAQAFSTPTITGLSPQVAQSNTAFTLTVTGAAFGCPATVVVGSNSIAASPCSSTSLGAAVPALGAGTYPVQVQSTNPVDGGALSSNSVDLSVVAPNPVPTLSALSPSTALAGGAGFTLAVTGTSFVSGAVVSVNGASRTTTFVSATEVDAAIPASDLAAPGSLQVVATNPSPGGGASSALTLSVVQGNPVPSISGLSPSSAGEGSALASLTIDGAGFISSSQATLSGASRTTHYVSATQLTVDLLAADTQTAGTYPVVATNPGPGGGASNSYSFSVVAQNPVPTLSALSPATATAGGASFTLSVIGTNFVSSSTVKLNGIAKATTFVSATQLQAAVSSSDVASAGSLPVVVSNPSPGGGDSNSLSLAVVYPAPTVASISPSAVAVGSAAFSLTVTGTGFVSGSQVTVDGSPRTTSVVSSTQLTASLLASDAATAGTHSIAVVNPTPGGGTSNTVTLTAAASNPVPTVSTLSPCGTVAGAGDFTLTVNGNNFVNGAVVKFQGTALATTFVSATRLTATVNASLVNTAPALTSSAPDAAAVTVVNPSPGGGPSSTVYFGVAAHAQTLSNIQSTIFTPSCAKSGCHVSTSPSTPVVLEAGKTYAATVGVQSTTNGCSAMMEVLACGPLATQSVMANKLLANLSGGTCAGSAMPKNGSITQAQIQSVIDWIAQGAPNN